MSSTRKRTRCPNGQHKNKKTGKCEKIKNTKKIYLPISRKQKIVVKIKKIIKKKTRRKRCPNGKRRNKNGKCVSKEKKKLVVSNMTPLFNKSLRKSINKISDYSPSINRQLATLKSLSPIQAQGCADSASIKVQLKNGKTKCLAWTSKRAQKIMLNNLVSKKPIDCAAITAPKQAQSNCWFNAFFVTFFISDKGRKFNRWLREVMIAGKLTDGRKISKKLHKSLFSLNKFINASLRSPYDDTNFADLMDTNILIKNIFGAVGRKINIKNNETLIAPVDKASNPLSFYRGLYEALGGDPLKWLNITSKPGIRRMAKLGPQFRHYENEAFAKVIYFEIYDAESKSFHKPKQFIIKRRETDGIYAYTYSLDSAILRNTEQFHFSAYLTCNGKDYGFDGESFSRMQPFNWKTKLNRNSQWRFAEQHEPILILQRDIKYSFIIW